MKNKIILLTICFSLIISCFAYADGVKYYINSITIDSDDDIDTLYEYVLADMETSIVKADYILKNSHEDTMTVRVKLPEKRNDQILIDEITATVNGRNQTLNKSGKYFVFDLKLQPNEAKKIKYIYKSKDLNKDTERVEYIQNPNVFKVQELWLSMADRIVPEIKDYYNIDRYKDGLYSLKYPYSNTYESMNTQYNPHYVEFETRSYPYENIKDEKALNIFKESRQKYLNNDYAGAFLQINNYLEEKYWNELQKDEYSYYYTEEKEYNILRNYADFYLCEYMIDEVDNVEVNKIINNTWYLRIAYYRASDISNNYYFSKKPLEGYLIVLDPGHQAKGNTEQEQVYPGSTETKDKNTSGAVIPREIWDQMNEYYKRYSDYDTESKEYERNLRTAMGLENILTQKGATVIMTRENNDVDLSNIERAEIANEKKAHLTIKIHYDSFSDSSANGATLLIPSAEHLSEPKIYEPSKKVAEYIKDVYDNKEDYKIEYYGSSDIKMRNITERADMTGLNWSKVPAIFVEYGFLSNLEDVTAILQYDASYYMNQVIANALIRYFSDANVIKYYNDNGFEPRYTDEENEKRNIIELSVKLENGDYIETVGDATTPDKTEQKIKANNVIIICSSVAIGIIIGVGIWLISSSKKDKTNI